MNLIPRLCFVRVILIYIAASVFNAAAIDISETVWLDRYTILTNGSLQSDYGHLLKTGKFRSVTSEIVDPIYYDSLDDFLPISGRPIMDEQLYSEYKYLRLIPRWLRSRDEFNLGFSSYVIVAVSGKADPNPFITIINHPESDRVLQGETAIFRVWAEPLFNLSYQWQFKGKALVGETSSFLFVPNVGRAQAGIYTVSLNTGGKSVRSRKALLTVVQPVGIKTGPKSQTIRAGKTATFRVAVTGTGPFRYKWFRDDNWITNATKSYYSIRNAQPSDAGAFSVKVDNVLSEAYSTNAILTVNP